MALIHVNQWCNVRTQEHSRGYNQKPEITVPSIRATLDIDRARTLANCILEAVAECEKQTLIWSEKGLPCSVCGVPGDDHDDEKCRKEYEL